MEPKAALAVRGEVMPMASTPQEVLSLAITHNVEPTVLKQMLDVVERADVLAAKKEYVKAMAAFKRETPSVLGKDSKVDFTSTKGRTHYNYASLGSIIGQLTPKLSEHGLSVSFGCHQEGTGIAVTCQITHERGHSESVTLTAPPDDTGGKNRIQQVGSTVSYLQRYTLLAALGLATADQDDDGIASGARRDAGAGGEPRGQPANPPSNTTPAPAQSDHDKLADEAAAAMDGTPQETTTTPVCPQCGGEMAERNGKTGKFWGCKGYPKCRGTLNHDAVAQGASGPAPASKGTPQASGAPQGHQAAPGAKPAATTGGGIAPSQANRLRAIQLEQYKEPSAWREALTVYGVTTAKDLSENQAADMILKHTPPAKCPSCEAAGTVKSNSATEWVCSACGCTWTKGQN